MMPIGRELTTRFAIVESRGPPPNEIIASQNIVRWGGNGVVIE